MLNKKMITKQTISLNITDDIYKLASVIDFCVKYDINYVSNTIDVCNYCGKPVSYKEQILHDIDEETIKFLDDLINYESYDEYENHIIMIPNCCETHKQKFIKNWNIQKYLI